MEVLSLELRKDCVRARELNQDGIRQYRKGHVERAEVLFRKAVAADERYGPAHNNLGSLYLDQRDLYQAAWAFQRAVEFMPDRAEPFNNLGLTYEAAGRLEEAIEMYSSAVELESANPEYLGNLMRARLLRGDRDESVWFGLRELVFIDKRPEWIEWAEDQLALKLRGTSPPAGTPDANNPGGGPEVLPAPRASGASDSHQRSPNVIAIAPDAAPPGNVKFRIHDGPGEAIPFQAPGNPIRAPE
jgi:tetratricopeptide (TPR) repeat protein